MTVENWCVPSGPRRKSRRQKLFDYVSAACKRVLTLLSAIGPLGRWAALVTLLVLLGLLTSCATPTPPETLPKNPQPPQLSEPIPQESYSSAVAKFLRSLLPGATGM